MARASESPNWQSEPADLLRDAFMRYAESVRWRWAVLVYPVPRSSRVPRARSSTVTSTAVRVDLTPEDAAVLAALLDTAADPGNGQPPRAPIGAWMGTEDVAARLGVKPGTVRGWIARGGPKGHPLPPPDGSYHRRNYWQKSTIDAWKTEQERIRPDRRRTADGP